MYEAFLVGCYWLMTHPIEILIFLVGGAATGTIMNPKHFWE